MTNPIDINYLNAVGEFCKIYGGWAVAIFEGFFIMYLIKLQRKDRRDAAATFADYHDELVDMIKEATQTKMSVSSRVLEQLREVRTIKEVLHQLVMSCMGGGKVDIDLLLDENNHENHTVISFLKEKNGEK